MVAYSFMLPFVLRASTRDTISATSLLRLLRPSDESIFMSKVGVRKKALTRAEADRKRRRKAQRSARKIMKKHAR